MRLFLIVARLASHHTPVMWRPDQPLRPSLTIRS
jgi:hypothetical protein